MSDIENQETVTTDLDDEAPPAAPGNGIPHHPPAEAADPARGGKDRGPVVREARGIIELIRSNRKKLLTIRNDLVSSLREIDAELRDSGLANPAPPAGIDLGAPAPARPRPGRPKLATHTAPQETPARRAAAATGVPAPTRHARASTAKGRLNRRSPDQVREQLNQIVELLEKHPDGIRSEMIQRELGFQPREMPLLLKEGLNLKIIRKRGEKRATMYMTR